MAGLMVSSNDMLLCSGMYWESEKSVDSSSVGEQRKEKLLKITVG
jgi:hypothetical protein